MPHDYWSTKIVLWHFYSPLPVSATLEFGEWALESGKPGVHPRLSVN